MSSWDLHFTHEHLKDLYMEAHVIRLTKDLHPERTGLLSRSLSRVGDMLIDTGVWLKSRTPKPNGKPYRFILLDLG